MHRRPRLTRNKHTPDKCLLCWFPCVCSSTLIQWSEEDIVQWGFKQHPPPLSFLLPRKTKPGLSQWKKLWFFSKWRALKKKVSIFFFSGYVNMINLNIGREGGQELEQEERMLYFHYNHLLRTRAALHCRWSCCPILADSSLTTGAWKNQLGQLWSPSTWSLTPVVCNSVLGRTVRGENTFFFLPLFSCHLATKSFKGAVHLRRSQIHKTFALPLALFL